MIKLVIVGNLAAVCYAISHVYGISWTTLSDSDRKQIEKSLYSSNLLYICSMGLTRLSISFFTARLSRERKYKPLVHVLSGVCAAWTFGSMIAYAVRGNLREPWTELDITQTMVCLGFSLTGSHADRW